MKMPSRDKRGRRTWPQRFVILMNLAAIAGFVTAGVGLGYGYTKFGRLPRVEIGEFLTESTEDTGSVAQNFLIVGIDSADGLNPDDPVRSTRASIGGLRSDTMIILRVDPASSRAAMLSIPRDLLVPIDGYRGRQKINGAVGLGGPELLIETIQDYLGVPINHYVQIDFFGFYRLVEAIDGVPIYFPHPVRDRRSGLAIPEAGCRTLAASDALAFVRSRAYQEQVDGRWRTDGSGDFGRIRRQQEFIQRALQRAVEKGIRNPVTVDELVDAALDAVAVDDTLRAEDFLSLARTFRSFNASALDIYELPVGDASSSDQSALALIEFRAKPLLDIFRGLDPDDVTEKSVRVVVLNGTGNPGEASDVSSMLRTVGFSTGGVGDAGRLGGRTEIRHAVGSEAAADLLSRWMIERPRIVRDDDVSGVTLVTGDDFDGFLEEPRPAGPTTTTTLPRTTTTQNGSGGPTTTILGTIPVETPPEVDCG